MSSNFLLLILTFVIKSNLSNINRTIPVLLVSIWVLLLFLYFSFQPFSIFVFRCISYNQYGWVLKNSLYLWLLIDKLSSFTVILGIHIIGLVSCCLSLYFLLISPFLWLFFLLSQKIIYLTFFPPVLPFLDFLIECKFSYSIFPSLLIWRLYTLFKLF